MQVSVTYNLSAKAQKDALVLGQDASAQQTVQMDDPNNILLPYVSVSSSGEASIDLARLAMPELVKVQGEYFDGNVYHTLYADKIGHSYANYRVDNILATPEDIVIAINNHKFLEQDLLSKLPQVRMEADADFETRKTEYIEVWAQKAKDIIALGNYIDWHGLPIVIKVVEGFNAELFDQCVSFNAESQRRFDERKESQRKKDQAKADRQAAKEREAERLEEEAKDLREKRKAEKIVWVAAHGSDHLRTAIAEKYDCQRLYVTERSNIEFPGFIPVFKNDYTTWNDCACPTEEALTASLNVAREHPDHSCRVVWLTSSFPSEAKLPCEALCVANYLGDYALIQIVTHTSEAECLACKE